MDSRVEERAFGAGAVCRGGAPRQRGAFAQGGIKRRQRGLVGQVDAGGVAAVGVEIGGKPDQIVAGALVAEASMRALSIDTVDICPWALREGLILRKLDSEADGTALVEASSDLASAEGGRR